MRKPSREIRLAFLCYLLHKRMQTGKASINVFRRHYKLVIALEKEKTFKELNRFVGRAA
jgi:hypothetical protein